MIDDVTTRSQHQQQVVAGSVTPHKSNKQRNGGERYRTHVRWLRDSNFLRDLERDNVDSDVIDEELATLREDDSPLTKRERLVKFLRSNHVQTLLCSIVLMDACIVIAQILLDINSVKDRLAQRDYDLSRLAELIQSSDPDRLRDYATGSDVMRHAAHDSRRHASDSPSSADHIMVDRKCPSCGPEVPRSARSYDAAIDRQRSPVGDVDALSERLDDYDVTYDDGYVDDGYRDTTTLPPPLPQPPPEPEVVSRDDERRQMAPHVDIYRQVAHSLHFVSIAILGFLVLEDLVRIVAMGSYICRHKIEIFDAIAIGTSFTVDIVFLGGVTGDNGQKAAIALVVLLVWRVARVVDGIIMTVKQRQEFRIRLQRRARRRVEKQLENAEEERQRGTRELEALQDLCVRAGVRPEDIEAVCSNAKSPKRLNRMLQAFSSVARLSFGMTLPASRASSRRSSRVSISRHPSDGFLPDFGGPGQTSEDDDSELAVLGSVATARGSSPSAPETPSRRVRIDAVRSPPRERSNSDATVYYGGGRSSSSRRRGGRRGVAAHFRRAIFDRLTGRYVAVTSGTVTFSRPEKESMENIGLSILPPEWTARRPSVDDGSEGGIVISVDETGSGTDESPGLLEGDAWMDRRTAEGGVGSSGIDYRGGRRSVAGSDGGSSGRMENSVDSEQQETVETTYQIICV